MAVIVGRALLVAGLVLLMHAAVSTVQHRSFLSLEGDEFTSPPLDVLLELAVGFAVAAAGVFASMTPFLPIKTTAQLSEKSPDTVAARPEFVLFNHRGRVLGGMLAAGN